MLKRLKYYDHELSIRWALCGRPSSPYLYLRKLIMILEFSGSGYVWIPYVIIMIGVHYTSMESVIPYVLFSCGLLVDIALVGTAKATFRRQRPVINRDDVLSIGPDKFSFPSGHTSRAVFLLFYFVHVSFFPSIPVSVITIWLSAVIASRILLGRHYISDLFAGFIFGVVEFFITIQISPIISQLVVAYYQK